MKIQKIPLSCLFLSLFIIACESTAGPCVHVFEEPILTIQSVSEEGTENEIATVKLTDIYFNDEELTDIPFSENITVDNSQFVCTVPCGFGTEMGTYKFTISSEGYQNNTITKQATYSGGTSGCPSSSDNGTKLSLQLSSE